jgi:hypothetical protein
MPGQDPRKTRLMQGPSQGKKSGRAGLGLLGKKLPKEKEGKIRIIMVGEDGEMLDQPMFEKFSKGGRAGYKSGSKCKLATKGKGRAYGKNS